MLTLKNCSKKIARPLAISSLLLASGVAVADPIEGYWIYYNNQKPMYVVAISPSGQGFAGVVAGGSKRYNGKTVLTGVKAQGGGQYGGGTVINPADGGRYNANLTLNGDVLTMRAYKGVPTFGLNYTFKRLPAGYTFKNLH